MPAANALGGTLRRECLDFLIPLGGRHLAMIVQRVGNTLQPEPAAQFARPRVWFTWNGEMLEDKGVVPDLAVEPTADALSDPQLERAIEVARQL